MAEDMKAEETTATEKHVAYKLLKPLGENKEGEVLYLPEEVGEALVEAGLCELADGKDVNGQEYAEDKEDEEEMGTAPVVASAVNRLTAKVEKAMGQAVAKTMANQKKTTSAPAAIREPIYKSPGAMIKDLIKWRLGLGDNTMVNRLNAYQEEAAGVYQRLGFQEKAAPLGINEGTQAQGGFLVNPEFSPDVYVIPHGQIDLREQVGARINARSNIYNQRFVNESSLANGSIFGGLNMVGTTEGNSLTSSLPAWSSLTFTLQKFAIFVYYTSEWFQDASNFYPVEQELNEYTTKAFVYGLNTQIIQGSTLEGALNAPSLVTVTKSSNDTGFSSAPATSLTYADLASMWAQVYADAQASPRGLWLFHPSLVAPLVQMSYTFNGATPAWGLTYDAQDGLEGNGSGFPGTPYRIFGKRGYPCWAMSAPGSAGDIMYIDFNTFRTFEKPYRVEVSKEFQFGTDQVAVRFINRLDSKTVFRNKITGPTGTQQFSALVTRSASGS